MKEILVVEDNIDNYQIVRRILTKLDTNVYHVKNGKDALKYLENNSIDLVVMDFGLPEINGGEITKIIKKNNPNQKVLFHTCYDEISPSDYGADDIAYKPIDRTLFLNQVNNLLDAKKILLLEDELIQYISITNFLQDYIIDWAKDGKEGLEKLTRNNYDLIITDIEMPIMNGLEFIKKAVKYNKPILTYSTSDEINNALNLGAVDKLPKPLNTIENRTKLINTIQKYI